MKCLVTGSSGFIGSHLVESLRKDGHEVVGVDRKLSEWTNLQYDLMDVYEGDFAGDSFEVVFHLAAATGLERSWKDLEAFTRDNILATNELIWLCGKFPKLRRLVLASTSSVYGKYADQDEDHITGRIRMQPCSPYGITKLAAEHLCLAHELPLTILRLFSVYGPRQRPDMGVYKFIDAVLKDEPVKFTGTGHRRSFTYVDDVVEALKLAGRECAHRKPLIANVGGPTESVEGVVAQIAKLGSRMIRFAGDVQPRRGDQEVTDAKCGTAHSEIGWRPKTPLSEGLRRQFDWQRTQLQTAL